MPPVRFCWLCDGIASGLSAPHYEDDRTVYFCSAAHRDEYQQLAQL